MPPINKLINEPGYTPMSVDAFLRLRTSVPYTIFDSKQIYDDPDIANNAEQNPLFFDNQEVSGSGTTTTFNVNRASTVLAVSNATAGRRIRQTKRRFNYQPGKSQLVIFTEVFGPKVVGVTKKAGYFDDNNGIFLQLDGTQFSWIIRSNVTGTPVDSAVAQSEWNIDKLDGFGNSGLILDPTKIIIPFLDFEWLGAGTVAVGFIINRNVYYVHFFDHANVITSVYMSTPNLPLRCEISNSGVGAAASLEQVCATIISEGGSEDTGIVRSVSTNGAEVACTVENTIYALVGIKLKANYLGATIKLLNAALQIQSASSKIQYMILFNPTVAGSFTYSNLANSAVQTALGATANTVTGGTMIASGFAESGGAQTGNAGSDQTNIFNALTLGSTIAGVSDTIVLCARPVAGSTNVNVEGALTFRELL